MALSEIWRMLGLTGVSATATRLADLGLAIVKNRIELVSIELREQQQLVLSLALWAAVAVILGFMFLTLATAAIVLLTPEEHRMGVILGCLGVFGLGALLAALKLRAVAKSAPAPFAATLNELEKDRRELL